MHQDTGESAAAALDRTVGESPAARLLAAEHALHVFDTGVIVVDADLRVLFVNASGRRFVGPAGPFRIARGRLGTRHAEGRRALLNFLGLLRRPLPAAGVYLRHGAGHGRDLWLHAVQPVRRNGSRGTLPLVLTVTDPREHPRERARGLVELFGLTFSEALVCLALASGMTARAVAAARRVETSTVRSQIRAALHKTRTRNLADLARTIVRVPVAHAAG